MELIGGACVAPGIGSEREAAAGGQLQSWGRETERLDWRNEWKGKDQ